MRIARARQREADALKLREAGATLEMIAKHLGLRHKSGAHKVIRRALDRIPAEAVEQLRQVEMLRLETATRAIWANVTKGELDSINVFLRISDRRAALMGLDLPVMKKVEVDLPAGGPTPGLAAALMREAFKSAPNDKAATERQAGEEERPDVPHDVGGAPSE